MESSLQYQQGMDELDQAQHCQYGVFEVFEEVIGNDGVVSMKDAFEPKGP